MIDRDLGQISKRDAFRLNFAARAGMIAGLGVGTLGIIACGAKAEKQPDPTSTDVSQPTATREIPSTFTPIPEVTVTPTVAGMPIEAEEILRDIDSIVTWDTPTYLEMTEKFRSDLETNGEGPEDYIQLYTYVKDEYCRPENLDGAIIPLMEKIEGTIQKKWPDLHSSMEADGSFFRLETQCQK